MKHGNQKPTFSVIGRYKSSLGEEVADMFEEDGGASFYPSQRRELTLMLARTAKGAPAATTLAISKPRQNGKSYAARFYAVYMAVFENKSVLYSAHHGNTSRKMFDAVCELFDSPDKYPEFHKDVKRISRARGYEGIYLRDGGCIEFSTRTNSGARGGTYSVIIIDEAQELTTDQQEGMLPVMSAAADANDEKSMPQQVFIGTPPGPSCNGTVFADMHRMAHSAQPGKTWWLEWSIDAENIDEATVNRENVITLAYKTNPAMGYRIAEKTVLNEFDTMRPDGFARERLGWWTPVVSEKLVHAIDKGAWESCMSETGKPEGKTAYGVKFSADGASVCLCGAVAPETGKARISLIEMKTTAAGTRWLAEWLEARYKTAACVVIDGKNGVDLLVDRITDTWKAKGSIVKPTSKDVIAAASLLITEINEQTLTWYRFQETLNESALTSTKRPISGGFGFGGDCSLPIEACALALWGARTSKRNPGKKMRIG